MSPRCWTEDEIVALPETGAWFFGLVEQHHGTVGDSLVLAEIFPGQGWAYVEASEMTPGQWVQVLEDLAVGRRFGP